MSTYICEKCGCIDNSACGGNYALVKSNFKFFKDDYANNHYLCVECTPTEFSDGSKNEKAGKWHNRFPKIHWTEIGKENILKACEESCGNYTNAKEYFRKGVIKCIKNG